MPFWLVPGFIVLGIMVLAGCGDERQPELKPGTSQIGYQPDLFPDIPLPRSSYMPDPAYDQLALAVAGGVVRRFEVSLLQRENAPEQTGPELLNWFRRELAATGWSLAEDGTDTQLWRKDQEHLRLETGRSGSRTTIRLRLRPGR